jgi:transcription termination/antitermination protein NusG
MDDDIRTRELPGQPVSESDAPQDSPVPDDADERLHSEQAFRQEQREAEAADTIDNPGLAEVDRLRFEEGDTPLVDVSYNPEDDVPAEEAALHVAPDEPVRDIAAESDEVAGIDEPLGTSSTVAGIGEGEDDPGESELIRAEAAEAGVDEPPASELAADGAAPEEFEGENDSEGEGRDEDVVDTDYEAPTDEAVVSPAASADGSGDGAEPAASADDEAAAAGASGATATAVVEAPEEPETTVADPYRGPGEWYVVHTYAGYENKVKTNLESRIHTMQMEDKIFDVHIPMEDVMEIKGGKKQVVQKKVFPGYLLVKMVYDNDSWYVVRNTPGVTGFVAAGTGSKPTPLSRREVEKILAVKKQEVKPAFRLGFEERDVVRIISGPFADFNGTITEINIDQSKLKVLVNIFDRDTPVELGFDQVAKV